MREGVSARSSPKFVLLGSLDSVVRESLSDPQVSVQDKLLLLEVFVGWQRKSGLLGDAGFPQKRRDGTHEKPSPWSFTSALGAALAWL